MRHVIPRDEVQRAAVLSRDGLYRYALRRVWDPARPAVLFIGLNPSTADHRIDDPTIRRCVRFARDWLRAVARRQLVRVPNGVDAGASARRCASGGG